MHFFWGVLLASIMWVKNCLRALGFLCTHLLEMQSLSSAYGPWSAGAACVCWVPQRQEVESHWSMAVWKPVGVGKEAVKDGVSHEAACGDCTGDLGAGF